MRDPLKRPFPDHPVKRNPPPFHLSITSPFPVFFILPLQPLGFEHFFSVAKYLQNIDCQFCSASCSLWNKNASFPTCLYIETILQQKLWNLCPWRENKIGLDVIKGTFLKKRAPRCCCKGCKFSPIQWKGPQGWALGLTSERPSRAKGQNPVLLAEKHRDGLQTHWLSQWGETRSHSVRALL